MKIESLIRLMAGSLEKQFTKQAGAFIGGVRR